MPGSGDETENEDDKINPYDEMSYEELLDYFGQNPGQLEEADVDPTTKAQIEDYLASNLMETLIIPGSDPNMIPVVGDQSEVQGPPLPDDYQPPGVGTAPDMTGATGGNVPVGGPTVDPTIDPYIGGPTMPSSGGISGGVDPNVIPGAGSVYSGGVGAGAGTFIPISSIQGELDQLRAEDIEAYNKMMGNVTAAGTVEVTDDVIAAIEAMQALADAPGEGMPDKPGTPEATPDSGLTLPTNPFEIADDLTNTDPDDWELDIDLDLLNETDDIADTDDTADDSDEGEDTEQVVDDATVVVDAATVPDDPTVDVVTDTTPDTTATDNFADIATAIENGTTTIEDLVNAGLIEINEDVTTSVDALQTAIEGGNADLAELVNNGVLEVTNTQDLVEATAQDTQEDIADLNTALSDGLVSVEDLINDGFLDVNDNVDESIEDLQTAIDNGNTDLTKLIEDGFVTVGDAADLVESTAQDTQDVVESEAGDTQDLITTTSEGLADDIGTLQDALDDGLVDLDDLIDKGFIDLDESLGESFEDIAKDIADGNTTLAELVEDGFADVNTDIADSLKDVIGDLDTATSDITDAATDVTDAATTITDTAAGIEGTLETAIEDMQDAIDAGQVDIETLIDDGILDIAEDADEAIADIEKLIDTGQADIEGLIDDGIITISEDVVKAIGGLEGDLETIGESITETAETTQEAIEDAAEGTQDVVESQAGDTQDLVESTAESTQDVVESEAKDTQDLVTTTSEATQEAINELAGALGVSAEDITDAIEAGDNAIVDALTEISDYVEYLPEPIADALEPFFKDIENGITTLTSNQEKSLESILKAVGNLHIPIVSAMADSTADTIEAVTAINDTITGIAMSVYNKFFAPGEPGEAMTGDQYAADLAGTAGVNRSGPGTGAGTGGGAGSGVGGGGTGGGLRDPAAITDYVSIDDDTGTESGGGTITTDPSLSSGAQTNTPARPVPIADQQLYGGYMGQAQRLSGTLDTYPQLQQQASEQYGVQVASQFPTLNTQQQSMFAQYVTGKVQAKAGVGQDPGFLPYDIYNKVAPRLAEVLGDVGYYQYSSGRRIPGFMNYMPEYQDSMFNREDLGPDPLPGGPAVPPTYAA